MSDRDMRFWASFAGLIVAMLIAWIGNHDVLAIIVALGAIAAKIP